MAEKLSRTDASIVVRAAALGYCAGVRRALDLAWQARIDYPDRKIFTYGPLIHNEAVLKSLEAAGIQEWDEKGTKSETAKAAIIIIRAHGVAPEVVSGLESRGFTVIDATCPRVRRNQEMAARLAREGRRVIIAGDKDHGEVAGLRGYVRAGEAQAGKALAKQNENKPRLSTKTAWVNIAATGVESSPATVCTPYRNTSILFSDGRVKPESEKNASFQSEGDLVTAGSQCVALVGQSTMSGAEYREAAEKLRAELGTDGDLLIADTVCPEAEKRQDAVRELCGAKPDGVLVVGGKSSANTRRLFELAKMSGADAALIQGTEDIPARFYRMDRVGLSAGASTPDEVVDAVEKALQGAHFP